MIRGDPAIEEIFYWEANQTALNKPEPKLPGSGVHLITGPINIDGGMPGDILQVDILELDPRPNPEGKTFGTNSQKFAGYQFRLGKYNASSLPWHLNQISPKSPLISYQVKSVMELHTLVLEEPKPLLSSSSLKMRAATCFMESQCTCTDGRELDHR